MREDSSWIKNKNMTLKNTSSTDILYTHISKRTMAGKKEIARAQKASTM